MTRTAISPRLAIRIFVSGLEGTSDNVGLMDTPIATPNDENLPGVLFTDRVTVENEEGWLAYFSHESDESKGLTTDPWPGISQLDDSWMVRWVETTGSTNADLLQAALDDAPNRLVLVADHQSAGRGRLDRTWEAPAGVNLLVSVLIRTVPAFPHQLTQAVAVAAAETCEAVAARCGGHLQVDLKWPNDVLIGGRKLAGILASAGSMPTLRSGRRDDVGVRNPSQSGPDFVVVGLGLNIGWAPDGAVSLSEALGADFEMTGAGMRDVVLAGILWRLKGLLEDSAEVVHDRYRGKLATLGREVQAHLPSGEILEGRAVDVESDGRLVLLDACAITHRLDVGDIIHLR